MYTPSDYAELQRDLKLSDEEVAQFAAAQVRAEALGAQLVAAMQDEIHAMSATLRERSHEHHLRIAVTEAFAASLHDWQVLTKIGTRERLIALDMIASALVDGVPSHG